jgi:hypothetical protein
MYIHEDVARPASLEISGWVNISEGNRDCLHYRFMWDGSIIMGRERPCLHSVAQSQLKMVSKMPSSFGGELIICATSILARKRTWVSIQSEDPQAMNDKQNPSSVGTDGPASICNTSFRMV